MKLNKILLLLAIAAITSCTIVDLEDPLKGNITLTTDWDNRTSGIEQPTNYTVIVNNQTLNYTQPTNLLPELNTGTYPIYIYNTPDKISIAGTTATVATTGNQVDPMPGWLFTATTQTIYADFKKETIKAVMQQQIRQLTIILKPKGGTLEKVTSITANLSGVTGTWDFKTNQPTGSTLNMPLTFTKQDNGTWQATVRLLGITGTQQILTGTVTFEGGSPTDITLDSDLSAIIAKFNTDKITPFSLRGDMKETPTELGLVTSVTDWVRVDESVIAE